MSVNKHNRDVKARKSFSKLVIWFITVAVAFAGVPFQEVTSAADTDMAETLVTVNRSSLEAEDAVLENEGVKVTVSAEKLMMEIINKETGYTWKHTSEADDGLNDTWHNFAQSGVTITVSVNDTNTRQVSYTGTAEVYSIENGLEADISFDDVGVSFTVRYILEMDGLTVSIPFESLKETSDAFKLHSVVLYPFLGASNGQTEGFILIPDGPGALIDLSTKTTAQQPYSAPVYGSDIGFYGTSVLQKSAGTRQPDPVSAPVFGIGYEDNALMSYLPSGAEQAVISAYSSSIVTPYNWVSASFVYRDFYYQFASATQDISSGVLLNQESPNAIDSTVRFVILGGEDANYRGMAARLKTILIEDEILKPHVDKFTTGDLHASIFVADNKKALLGRTEVVMTEAEQALAIIEELQKLASGGIRLELDGYQKGGLTNQSPKLGRLTESDSVWKSVFESVDGFHDRLYLKRNYLRVYKGARGYNRYDIALNSSDQIAGMHNMSNITREALSSKDYQYYHFLNPEVAGKLLEGDKKRFENLGIHGLSFDTVGQILNSVYGSNALSRMEAAETHRLQLLSVDKDVALHDPSLYLWNSSQVFFDMAIEQTGYVIASYSVPFFPLVLAGNVELYAPYANFQSDINAYLLKILEYGLRPSYLLTWEDASLLLQTDSRWIYSSQWDVWKTRIEQHMDFLDDGLKAVREAVLIEHTSNGKEWFASVYSNGITIYGNYSDQLIEVDGLDIPPNGYILKKEGEGR